ncbi:MAG: phospholipase A [Betaproteobacteria bacterium]
MLKPTGHCLSAEAAFSAIEQQRRLTAYSIAQATASKAILGSAMLMETRLVMRFPSRRFLFVFCGLHAAALCAQPASPSECHAIDDAARRLACYDRVTQMPAMPPAQREGPVVPSPVAQPATPVPPGARQSSPLAESWATHPESARYTLQFHEPNYILFARHTNSVNSQVYAPVFTAAGVPEQIDATEAKFQLSGKLRVWTTDDRRWGAWVAYTQQSNWQVYNSDISRPFRETNYAPEVLLSWDPDISFGGWRWGLANLGLVHQSNGRTDVISRSWDRLYAQFAVENGKNGNLALYAKAWYRFPTDAAKDDNPDITDYLGHAQFNAVYRWREHSITGMLRGNLRTGKGALQVGYFSPRLLGPLRGYVQAFSGYGESMIDYNWRQTTLGIGVALNDGL